MAKKTGKKPYKFRQARKDAKAGAKGVFTGKRKAAVKDITTKQTLEEREALKELSDARKRQKAGKADFIVDDRGQRVDVKPTETAQERFARDRAAARAEALRKYPLDEAELGKEKARKARMEAKNKAAIAKQEADRAARRGRPAPTLQQTPANEKPLSRPVKKAAVKKVGTVGTTKKPDAKGVAKVVKEAKAIKATKKPGMTRAERSAANKAAWKNMTPAQRKNWSANKPGSKGEVLIQGKKYDVASGAADKKMNELSKAQTPKAKAPVQSVTNVQPEKSAKGTKKPKFVQKSVAATKETAKPSTGKAIAVRPKGAVATVAKEGAKKTAKAGALRTAGRFAGKLVGGRVGAALAIGSIAAGPIKNALSKDTKGRTTFDVLDKRAKAAAAAGGAKLDKAQYGRALPGGVKKAGRRAIAGGALLSGGVRKEAIAKGRIPATPGPGGSTIKQGSGYRVETGDTLSSIAKRANVTLAELREANKKIKDPRKIYRNTLIRIPKSGTTPNPMYTGPVPYVPGSKAAKKYEQSRKK